MRAVNGATERSRMPAYPDADPMARVLSMGGRTSSIGVALLLALAMMLHGGAALGATAAALFAEIAAWQRLFSESLALKLKQEFEVDREPPPPPPEEKREEAKEDPKPPPPSEPPPPKEAPPPAPAEAAQVIAKDPDPLDFTGDPIVQGKGETYAGGISHAEGTSKKAVTNVAATPTGVPGGTGTAPAPPPVDRSRGPTLSNPASLKRCPFPSEADAEQIDDAYVAMEIRVRPDGTAESVTILKDPGHGFAREGRKCVLRERFNAALDVGGNPIAGVSRINMHFER